MSRSYTAIYEVTYSDQGKLEKVSLLSWDTKAKRDAQRIASAFTAFTDLLEAVEKAIEWLGPGWEADGLKAVVAKAKGKP